MSYLQSHPLGGVGPVAHAEILVTTHMIVVMTAIILLNLLMYPPPVGIFMICVKVECKLFVPCGMAKDEVVTGKPARGVLLK